MRAAVLFLNFGEPERATTEEVVAFLERIFMLNAGLESDASPDASARAHELALNRAPGLVAEYQAIGGSPLNRQANEQAEATVAVLRKRGHDVRGYVGMQFTEPTIPGAVGRARADGADLLIALPVYPICGPSTNIAALEEAHRTIREFAWNVPVREISGWHSHSAYIELRADAIRQVTRELDIDFDPEGAERARLIFSAHGTPLKYLRAGSRYELYTQHACAAIAEALGVTDYELGYQNHSNRPIEWTQPGIEKVIEEVDAETVVIDPCSFMHEQSETLAELDHDMREKAEARGLKYCRVPVPYNDPRFITLLADLIEPFISEEHEQAGFRPCQCRKSPNTFCLNTVL